MPTKTKAEANYREGQPGKRCAICTMFRRGEPSTCTLVKGTIGANDLCDYFERKDGVGVEPRPRPRLTLKAAARVTRKVKA